MKSGKKTRSSETKQHGSLRIPRGGLEQTAREKVTKETYPFLCESAAKHVAERIRTNEEASAGYTDAHNTVCIISNGSYVHGHGNIGPDAVLPVLESKALLLHTFGAVRVVPLAVSATQSVELTYLANTIAPSCGVILFDSIAAPTCFDFQSHTQTKVPVPILESSQHGMAVVVLAGLINAHIVVGKDIRTSRVAVLGTGGMALAIIRLLLTYGVGDVIAVDKDGILHPYRTNLDKEKESLAEETNKELRTGGILEAVTGTDVVISLSKSEAIKEEYIRMMAQKPIVFALREHTPEVTPKQANTYGAAVIATRDYAYPNYVTDSLILPHLVRSLLQKEARKLPDTLCVKLARALASCVPKPSLKKILPTPFDRRIAKKIEDIF